MDKSLDVNQFLCSHLANLMGAISALQSSPKQFVLVVDLDGKLLGTVTDGDVRRALLRGLNLESPIVEVMNPNPFFALQSSGVVPELGSSVGLLPILDGEMRPVAIVQASEARKKLPNPVLLMAGGRGTRLMPYTRDTPKPLVEIHGKALIEMLIENFASHGFSRFMISVNHMAEQITGRLKDGSRYGVEIEYVHEIEPLGTAGALGLIRDRVDSTVLVANADLVTGCDFNALLDFH